MNLTVHQFAFSPYCIPVTAALEAFGVPFRAVEVPIHRRDEVITLTRGRYYQVPVLVHERKVVFERGGETLDVARYVDRTFARGRLFPAQHEGLQRILILHIETEVEAVTFKLVDPQRIADIPDVVERTESVRFKERRFGRGCLDAWRRDVRRLTAEMETRLAPFDLMLRRTKFLLGETPLYVDFALLGIVEALTFGDYVQLPDSCKALRRWQRSLRSWRA